MSPDIRANFLNDFRAVDTSVDEVLPAWFDRSKISDRVDSMINDCIACNLNEYIFDSTVVSIQDLHETEDI